MSKKKASTKKVVKDASEDIEFEIVETTGDVEHATVAEETLAPDRVRRAYMSHYEYAALIIARTKQLSSQDPLVELDPENPEDYDPINIATREVNQCLVSLIVRRALTDGSTEDWHPRDMIFPRM